MSLGLRLSLLPLLIAGCAAQRLEVPDSDWETVPAPARAAVDRQSAAELAAAQTELTAASAGLAELQRSLSKATTAAPAPTPPHGAPASPAPAAARPDATDDDWAAEQRDHEHARGGALARVEAAKTAWQRADLSWRELRLAAASEGLKMVMYKRELVRAQTIDHNLPGTDHYDVAPLRGQFSQTQQRWYTASSSARQARSALEHASATLASAKEAYAQLMRGVPIQPSIASDDRPAPLTLTGWSVTRADIRRRRGLRHFLDDAASAPAQLRKVAIRLTVRAVPAATTPTTVSTSGGPTAEVRGNTAAPAAPAAMHPADAAAAGLSTGPGAPDAVARSAGHPAAGAPGASAGSSKAAAASPAAPASGVARPGSPTSPILPAAGKPAPAAPQAGPPDTAAKTTTRPGAPASPGAAVPANSKPSSSAAQASPPVAAGNTVAKPSPTSAGGKPSPPPATPSPAGKPVD